MSYFQIVKLLFSLILTLGGDDKDRCNNPADSITEAELRDQVYFLASDEMGGRVIYSEKYRIAVDFVIEKLKSAGVKPLFMNRDGKPSYLQRIPFVKRSVVPTSLFTVKTSKGTHKFNALRDTGYFFYKNLEVFKKNLPLFFIGYGIDASDSEWNDFEGIDLTGKIAVVLAGAPEKDGEAVLPKSIHDRYETGNSVLRFLNKYNSVDQQKKKPAALLVITDNIIDRTWDKFGAACKGFGVYLAKDAHTGIEDISFDTMLINREVANALFEGQVYSPVETSAVDLEKYKTFELKGASINMDFEYNLEPFVSWNVAGLVEGTDPDLKEEHIVVGAHLDHIPPYRGKVHNGADDNASGSAGVMEIAEAIAMAPPRRPVVFAFWTGEEPVRGDSTMGSKYFLANPPIPLDQFKLNVNLDMIGRSSPENIKNRAHIIGSTDLFHQAVTRIVKEVNDRTIRWPIQYEQMTASDHMEFIVKGIPGMMFFSGQHPDVHRTTDDADKIDYEKMEKIAKLAYFVTMDLANKDTFPTFKNDESSLK